MQIDNMLDCNGISTPMVSSYKLSKFGSELLPNAHQYRDIVGALQYVTLTRPNIAYNVNKVSEFMSSPLQSY